MPPIKHLPSYSVDVVSFLKMKGFRIQTDDGKYNLRSPAKKYYVFAIGMETVMAVTVPAPRHKIQPMTELLPALIDNSKLSSTM